MSLRIEPFNINDIRFAENGEAIEASVLRRPYEDLNIQLQSAYENDVKWTYVLDFTRNLYRIYEPPYGNTLKQFKDGMVDFARQESSFALTVEGRFVELDPDVPVTATYDEDRNPLGLRLNTMCLNVLPDVDTFDPGTTDWVLSNLTPSASGVSSPLPAVDYVSLDEGTATGEHSFEQGISYALSGDTLTAFVLIRDTGRNLQLASGFNAVRQAVFDLENKQLVSKTVDILDANIIDLTGNGDLLAYITYDSASNEAIKGTLLDRGNSNADSYTGTSGPGIQIAHAQAAIGYNFLTPLFDGSIKQAEVLKVTNFDHWMAAQGTWHIVFNDAVSDPVGFKLNTGFDIGPLTGSGTFTIVQTSQQSANVYQNGNLVSTVTDADGFDMSLVTEIIPIEANTMGRSKLAKFLYTPAVLTAQQVSELYGNT